MKYDIPINGVRLSIIMIRDNMMAGMKMRCGGWIVAVVC